MHREKERPAIQADGGAGGTRLANEKQTHYTPAAAETKAIDYALRYAELGIAVFPLTPGTKEPATKAGFHDATTDPDQICTWWESMPTCGIGLYPHASGWAVLDVDVKNGGHGPDQLEALQIQHGQLPPTLTARTPSGATHMVFRCSEALGNHKLADDIDVRCARGYIVVEPTVLSDGNKYGWIDWEVDLEDVPEVAELPQWAIDIIHAKASEDPQSENIAPKYVKPDDLDALKARFETFLTKSTRVRARWSGNTDGLSDTSGSAMDYSMVALLKIGGFDYSETVTLLQKWPHGSSDSARNHKRYWERCWTRTSSPSNETRTYPDILADAENLDSDAPAEDLNALVRETGALNAIERRQVWNVIKRQTKLPFSVLNEALSAATESNVQDHLDLARTVIEQLGEQNVLAAQSFVWRWHDAGVWRKCEDRTVRGWSQHVLDDSEEVTKGLVDSVTDLLKTEIFKPDHEFDIGPTECVNTLNGEITLTGDQWEAHPHKREHYRTTQIPVQYDPAALAPRFSQFLDEVFPGADGKQQATAVLEMMGYSLMAHCRHERFIILVGNGANGKSVLLRVLESLCGYQNVSGVQPAEFDNKFQRAHLHGKLVNIVSEIEQGQVIDDAALKGIVSGEPSTVEHKFKDPFQMRPFSTCWFGTNHMPHTRDFSDALFRRALILKFDATFKPELGNCDPYLAEKLEAELPGILNMALNAYSHALTHGFTMPDSSEQARNEWRLEADQVAQFVEDMCIADPAAEEGTSWLYREYTAWASDNGINRTLGLKSFRDRLTRLGYGARRSAQVRYVTGLRVITQSDTAYMPKR